MGGEIFQLAFVASRRPDVQPDGSHGHQAILANSRSFYAARKVTGLLLVKGPRLLYHVEGDQRQVMTVFRRIESNPCVHGIVVLHRRFVERRAFAKWEFALDGGRASSTKSLLQQVEEFVADAPKDVAQHFLAFAKLEPLKAA